MPLILRNLKKSQFNNAEFRKYLLYALGEMTLVIIGILIALQIDNWNTNKLQQETLSHYLHTVAGNIGSDLASINELRSDRLEAYELGVRWGFFQSRGDSYSVPEISLAGQVFGEARMLRYFNASSSGYEALKNSGILDQLQGTDVEKLLFDYYDTVARLNRAEQDHNEMIRLLSLQVSADWPEGIEAWEITSVQVLTVDRFESLQPAYYRVLKDPTMQQLTGMPISVGLLLREYDRLDRLGKALRHLVEIDSMDLDDVSAGILDDIYDPRGGVGQPDIIVDGQVRWQNYSLVNSDANDPRVSYEASVAGLKNPFDLNSVQRVGDSLHINYHGGAAWAGIWFEAGTSETGRLSPDFSMYSKLLLELRGDAGGEKIVVNLEDRDDPADGTSTRYELELSDQWQAYEIDLAEFETADLSILAIPVGLVFFEEPVSFSIRTARFIEAD
jgi:hypothetical protein